MTAYSEVVERRFRMGDRPRLSAENVAGGTVVRGGTGDEIVVRATKWVEADSPERAKRLLENFEVRIEQEADEVVVEQRAYLAERAWLGLFRERRAWADYEIDVPERTEVSVRSASGEVAVERLTGDCDVATVSGDARVDRVRGHLRLRTVSGDAWARSCACELDATTVSGDLHLEQVALGGARVRTVSGDAELAVRLHPAGAFSIVTLSGDVRLATPSDCEVVFTSASGDVSAGPDADVQRTGRRNRVVRQGSAGAEVRVNTASGDLSLRRMSVNAPDFPIEEAEPAPQDDRRGAALCILERVATRELDTDEAARLLEALR